MLSGLARAEELDPEDVREVDVVERDQLVDVPVFVGAEEVPVRPAEERPQQDQDDPEHEEAVLERDVGELALVDRVVAVALLVGVDVGHRHQADDDHASAARRRHPGVEVDEHLLEARGSTTGPSTGSGPTVELAGCSSGAWSTIPQTTRTIVWTTIAISSV